MKYRVVFILTALIGCLLDLISKTIIFGNLYHPLTGEFNQVDIIPGVLGLKCTYNTGIIWGFFQGGNIFFLIFSGLAILLIIILFFLSGKPDWLISSALGLVLAGTLGNLYDRFTHQAVRDFIDFYLINWPIFNLADTWITIGVILIIISLFISPKGEIVKEAKVN